MADASPPPPPPLPPGAPGAGPVFYGTPPLRPAKQPWPAWKWGCLIAAIVGALVLAAGGLCCGVPLYQVRKIGGMAGAMGIGWLANVAQGEIDGAAQLTVGGRSETERLAKKIEAEIGSIANFEPDMAQLDSHVDKITGKAEVTLPLTGSKGTATCTVHLKQHPQMMWQVEDVTFETPAVAP